MFSLFVLKRAFCVILLLAAPQFITPLKATDLVSRKELLKLFQDQSLESVKHGSLDEIHESQYKQWLKEQKEKSFFNGQARTYPGMPGTTFASQFEEKLEQLKTSQDDGSYFLKVIKGWEPELILQFDKGLYQSWMTTILKNLYSLSDQKERQALSSGWINDHTAVKQLMSKDHNEFKLQIIEIARELQSNGNLDFKTESDSPASDFLYDPNTGLPEPVVEAGVIKTTSTTPIPAYQTEVSGRSVYPYGFVAHYKKLMDWFEQLDQEKLEKIYNQQREQEAKKVYNKEVFQTLKTIIDSGGLSDMFGSAKADPRALKMLICTFETLVDSGFSINLNDGKPEVFRSFELASNLLDQTLERNKGFGQLCKNCNQAFEQESLVKKHGFSNAVNTVEFFPRALVSKLCSIEEEPSDQEHPLVEKIEKLKGLKIDSPELEPDPEKNGNLHPTCYACFLNQTKGVKKNVDALKDKFILVYTKDESGVPKYQITPIESILEQNQLENELRLADDQKFLDYLLQNPLALLFVNPLLFVMLVLTPEKATANFISCSDHVDILLDLRAKARATMACNAQTVEVGNFILDKAKHRQDPPKGSINFPGRLENSFTSSGADFSISESVGSQPDQGDNFLPGPSPRRAVPGASGVVPIRQRRRPSSLGSSSRTDVDRLSISGSFQEPIDLSDRSSTPRSPRRPGSLPAHRQTTTATQTDPEPIKPKVDSGSQPPVKDFVGRGSDPRPKSSNRPSVRPRAQDTWIEIYTLVKPKLPKIAQQPAPRPEVVDASSGPEQSPEPPKPRAKDVGTNPRPRAQADAKTAPESPRWKSTVELSKALQSFIYKSSQKSAPRSISTFAQRRPAVVDGSTNLDQQWQKIWVLILQVFGPAKPTASIGTDPISPPLPTTPQPPTKTATGTSPRESDNQEMWNWTVNLSRLLQRFIDQTQKPLPTKTSVGTSPRPMPEIDPQRLPDPEDVELKGPRSHSPHSKISTKRRPVRPRGRPEELVDKPLGSNSGVGGSAGLGTQVQTFSPTNTNTNTFNPAIHIGWPFGQTPPAQGPGQLPTTGQFPGFTVPLQPTFYGEAGSGQPWAVPPGFTRFVPFAPGQVPGQPSQWQDQGRVDQNPPGGGDPERKVPRQKPLPDPLQPSPLREASIHLPLDLDGSMISMSPENLGIDED